MKWITFVKRMNIGKLCNQMKCKTLGVAKSSAPAATVVTTMAENGNPMQTSANVNAHGELT